MAIRARTPNTGFFLLDMVEGDILEKGDGRVPKRAIQKLYLSDEAFNEIAAPPEERRNQVWFHAFFKWDNTIRYLSGYSDSDRSIESDGSGMKTWNRMGQHTLFFLENYPAALDAPGERLATTVNQ